MIKNSNGQKPLHNIRESKEGQILRLIREFKKLSLKDVATKLNLKVADINHLENGRKFYTAQDIDLFLACYEISKEDFETLMSYKIINKILVNHFFIL